MTKQEKIRGWLEHNFHETNARVILDYLHSQGVVLKVEGELPKVTYGLSREYYRGNEDAQQDMLEAGYAAVKPLIEEAK